MFTSSAAASEGTIGPEAVGPLIWRGVCPSTNPVLVQNLHAVLTVSNLCRGPDGIY